MERVYFNSILQTNLAVNVTVIILVINFGFDKTLVDSGSLIVRVAPKLGGVNTIITVCEFTLSGIFMNGGKQL